MQTVPRVKTVRGPAILTMPDGSKWTTETTVTRIDQWRQTPFGAVNFGHVRMSPSRFVEVSDG